MPEKSFSTRMRDIPSFQDDPDILRQGNDVTILAPLVEVKVDLNLTNNTSAKEG